MQLASDVAITSGQAKWTRGRDGDDILHVVEASDEEHPMLSFYAL